MWGTTEEEGHGVWPLDSKKSMKAWRTRAPGHAPAEPFALIFVARRARGGRRAVLNALRCVPTRHARIWSAKIWGAEWSGALVVSPPPHSSAAAAARWC